MSALTPQLAEALPGPAWLRDSRIVAAERFAEAALPTSALEDWRYSRIDSLDLDRWAPAGATPPAAADARAAGSTPVEAALAELLSGLAADVAVVETVDGVVSATAGSLPGVAVRRAVLGTDGEGGPESEASGGREDAFFLANRAFSADPVEIEVSGPGATIVVVHRLMADDVVVFPRISVAVAENSEATVLEVFAGPGRCLVVPVTELAVAAAGRLSYTTLQLLGPEAWQIGLQESRVERDATLVSAAVALGGEYARLRTVSALAGMGASGRLLATYFGSGAQMHDFRTVQHHQAPRTGSDLLYKGVVANTSRSVYSGLIRVEKGARGTNAFQTNRNLVLHEGAHADSVPNLEIEDNDVRCSHASAVGPIAEDERFYLESRGVPPEVTERLIALGFVGEVLEQLPHSATLPLLRLAVASKLAGAEEIQRGRAA